MDRRSLLVSIFATILLLFFSFCLWFYKDLYNGDQFRNHALTAVRTQESRNALSSLIIEQSFNDRPVLKNALLEQAQPALAGGLNGPRVETVMVKFIDQIHQSIFSNHPRAIVIDLGSVKSFVETLVFLVEAISDDEVANVTIPDTIVLVREGDIPAIGGFASVVFWLGPLSLIIGMSLLVWLLWKSKKRLRDLMQFGLSLLIGSAVAVFLVKMYQPLYSSHFENGYSEVIASEIYTEFTNALNFQNAMLFLIGFTLLAGGFLLQRYGRK